MIVGVDHVVLVATDLDAAVAEYRARGFTVTPGGVHAGGVSHNALVGLADGSYIELFAFRDPGEAAKQHRWSESARRGGGWTDFALRTDDLVADATALRDLVDRNVQEGGRKRPDGVEITWRLVLLKPPLPFLIQDVTARELRVPGGTAAQHPGGITRIASIVLGARDPEALAKSYARLRERGAPAIEIRKADRDGLIDVVFA